MAQTFHGGIEHRAVVGIYDRLNPGDIRVLAERLHGTEDHGHTADGPILLRTTRAGAETAAGRYENYCRPPGIRHRA
jgi:hypothetical protein